jgi:Uma2 family endonuclease
MKWLDVCKDRNLQNLPYKIELNKAGKIIMSPTRNRHGYYASKIARLLSDLMSNGESFVELAVETKDSTKVADAAWASPRVFRIICDEISCSIAPEICVEVRSPFNLEAEMNEKRTLYLEAGAKEFWLCDESGNMTFFNATGRLKRSKLCPKFPVSV